MPMRRDLPLRRPGMQVRRQPIRRATPKLRSTQIYALVLMFLCVMTVVSLGSSPIFAARHLQVYGARYTGEAAVRRIVGMDGSPNLFRLHSDRVALEVANLPAVDSVRVDVRLPDTIVVTVVEREPSMIWAIGDRRYVVDDTGLLFGEVDSVGNPVYSAVGTSAGATGTAAPGSLAPDSGAGASAPSGSPGETSSADATDASATGQPDGRVAQPAKVTPKPTAKVAPKPTPKVTPKPSSSTDPSGAPSASASVSTLPSLLPIPTPDPAETPGPQVVNLPTVVDRRAQDAHLTLGDVIDPIALDAGFRIAGLAPGDIGSRAASLSVILDDPYGFTLSSGPNGWVAEFGFYTETLRKDTVIPMQVRDLKALLLNSGETHVAWVWLVADIADNRVNTYISK